MSDSDQMERSVFLQALEIESCEERAEYLARACAGRPELRAAIEELLAAHDNAPRLLRMADAPTIDSEPDLTERPGTTVGTYKLLEQIGEGGFGVVFMAEQTEPIRRKVAVKVLKLGMDTQQVVARFEAERQALAMMDHPHIAKVLDGGTTASGRPYFVMELVRGVSITEYCSQNQLTTLERLELFISVCNAVQHAHQKAVIHRDLKPSNVLVAVYDTRPVVKVIDFGVAKALGHDLTDKTMFTGFGQLIGTPLYMSPEQAGHSDLDIDTRSDIYSLGVLLYELITGTTPLTKERFKQASYDEILRVIRDEEPPTPSARLTQLRHAEQATKNALGATTRAANDRGRPAEVRLASLQELDWIVMKALEKDRTRRYATAHDLALDLQRLLANEPVLACPPSRAYRLRKFLRRNRGAVLAASLVMLALVGGIVGTTLGLIRANEAWKSEANRATKEQQANAMAQKRLIQIEQGIVVLSSVFQDLDPRAEEKEGRPLRVILGDRLMKAAEQLEDEAIGDPVVVASLQNRLGHSLTNLGLANEGVKVLQKARATLTKELGAAHPDTLDCLNHLAVAHKYAGDLRQAIAIHEEAFAARKARFGLQNEDTLTSLNNLAAAYRDQGEIDRAIPLHEQALQARTALLGERHPDTLVSMNNLAMSYHKAQKLDEGVALFEKALAWRKEVLGPEHPSTLTSMNNLALGYKALGRDDEGRVLEEETYRLRKLVLGNEHPDTLTIMNNLAISYQVAGQNDRALPLLEETLKINRQKLGPRHYDTLTAMNNMATALERDKKLEEATKLFEETLQLRREVLGEDHPNTLTSLGNLANAYYRAEQPEKALPLLETAAAGLARREFRHPHAVPMINNLATIYESQQQFDQAEVWLKKILAALETISGPKSPPYASALVNLAINLKLQKKYAEAEPLLLKALAIVQSNPDQRSHVLKGLVELYTDWENPAEAARWQRQLDAAS